MARRKIDYGIDLGTTNSAIARLDSGTIRIIKSDVGQSDTTPSCVYIISQQDSEVGVNAIKQSSKEAVKALKKFMKFPDAPVESNLFVEFKRTMGTDVAAFSTNANRSFSSEELSAEVLKKLKSYVRDDDEVKAAVITVPAMFGQNQIAATQRAAEMAGFQYCELLQEPIAASIAYGLITKKPNGYWLVFDFGGGTFDAALMRVVDGIIKVVDTAGNTQLGGKDIDWAIVDNLLLPYVTDKFSFERTLSHDKGKKLLRGVLKGPAEQLKIDFAAKKDVAKDAVKSIVDGLCLDEEGNEVEWNFSVTLAKFDEIVSPILQQAIDITNALLNKNGLKGSALESLIFVGGPTYLQTMRRMVRAQISENIDVSIDPMTAVACGAALFASTKELPSNLVIRNKAKVQLKLIYTSPTVETEIKLGIKIERGETTGPIPRKIFATVERSDKAWTSGKVEIVDDAEMIDIHLNQGKANGFSIALFDEKGNALSCEPSSFSIIHGSPSPNATLPSFMCIEAFHSERGEDRYTVLDGLEKNQPLPAKGKVTLRTQKDLRPGNLKDLFEIPIYETQNPDSRPYDDEHVATIPITAEGFSKLLPKDSEVRITINVDSSRRMSMSVDIPYLDETFKIEIKNYNREELPDTLLDRHIEKARKVLAMISSGVDDLDTTKQADEIDQLADMLEKGGTDADTKLNIAKRLKDIWKEIDRLRDAGTWPMVEKELQDTLAHAEMTLERYGSEKHAKILDELRKKVTEVVKRKNIKLAADLRAQIDSLDFSMVRALPELWIGYIKSFDEEFDSHNWSNKTLARKLVSEAKKIIATSPSADKLQPIVRQLYELLPEPERPVVDPKDARLLKK